MPIRAGDEVIAFIVEYTHATAGSGICYPSDVATAISLPIYARYNDYGGIEDYDPESLSIKLLCKDFGTDNHSKLIHNIERDTVTTTRDDHDGKANIRDVGIIMIHQFAFDDLEHTCYPGNYGINKEKVLNAFDKIKNIPDDSEFAYIKTCKWYWLTEMAIHVDILQQQSVIDIIDFVINLGDSRYEKEFAHLMDVKRKISDLLARLRKTWSAQSGKGSQSLCRKTHLALANSIRDYITQEIVEDMREAPEELYLTFLGKYEDY
jgi:hypothetical protein